MKISMLQVAHLSESGLTKRRTSGFRTCTQRAQYALIKEDTLKCYKGLSLF